MPGKDGVETLVAIRKVVPDVMVVMMSGTSTRNAEVTVRALQSGAFDFIRKPSEENEEKNQTKLRSELTAMVRLAAISLNAREAMRKASSLALKRDIGPVTSTIRLPTGAPYSALLVGASTGGPEALGRFLPSLPADFPLPVLVAQHMPAHFTEALARSLDRRTKLRVVEAVDGQSVEGGAIYLAPGGHDMAVARRADAIVTVVKTADPVLHCHPNVNTLFSSAAVAWSGRMALVVVMTGMGDDGLEGVRALKRAGACHCIVQSAATCVVFGMPRAVAEAGLADMVLPLDDIALDVAARVKLSGVMK